MRALQLRLGTNLDFLEESSTIEWDDSCCADILWWTDSLVSNPGTCLHPTLPDISLWTDASDTGGGTCAEDSSITGIWSGVERSLSINLCELRAILLALPTLQTPPPCPQVSCSPLRQHDGSGIPLEGRGNIIESPQCRVSLDPPLGGVQ